MTDRPFLAETCTADGHVPHALEHKGMRFTTFSEAQDWALSHIEGSHNAVKIFRLEPVAVIERTISIKIIDHSKVNGVEAALVDIHDTEGQNI